MKKAELERRLAAAESALIRIGEICDRSGEDVLKEFNEESIRSIGKAIHDADSVYPLKLGMIKAESDWYLDYER